MVILFSEQNSKTENEVIQILKKYGGNHISLENTSENKDILNFANTYKKSHIPAEKGIALFLEKNHNFDEQKFSADIIGICEENNKIALRVFQKNNNAVITCGINGKNTVTLSSINNKNMLITLQRSIIDINKNQILPCEIKINLTKEYTPFSIMSAATVLLLNGIIPQEF